MYRVAIYNSGYLRGRELVLETRGRDFEILPRDQLTGKDDSRWNGISGIPSEGSRRRAIVQFDSGLPDQFVEKGVLGFEGQGIRTSHVTVSIRLRCVWDKDLI